MSRETRRPRLPLLLLAVSVLVLHGCSDDADADVTTTSVADSGAVTSAPGSAEGSTTTVQDVGTDTTLRGQAVDQYRQAHSEETASGEVIHLVIPRAGYTDIDIENFLRDLRQSSTGIWGVELFDSEEAQEAFMVPAGSRTDEQRTLVARHHLASLVSGDTLVWRGPFASLGQVILGS